MRGNGMRSHPEVESPELTVSGWKDLLPYPPLLCLQGWRPWLWLQFRIHSMAVSTHLVSGQPSPWLRLLPEGSPKAGSFDLWATVSSPVDGVR